MNNTGDKSGNSVAELENVENNFGYGVRNDSLNNVKINFKRQISDNAIGLYSLKSINLTIVLIDVVSF